MIEEIFSSGRWLPYTFASLIGLSMLLYAILDGYDLGLGFLTRRAEPTEADRMIASVGPFWDANETWLVLGVGLLLVAFPAAHGVLLSQVYLPVSMMIAALIFRGVSFDFRSKAPPNQRPFWNAAFFWGSLVASICQGYIVGRFITGFASGVYAKIFAVFFGALVVAGYALMGATWLIGKCEGILQKKAVRWARQALWSMVVGAVLTSAIAPWVDTRIYDTLLAFPQAIVLVAMPLVSMFLTLLMELLLRQMPLPGDRLAWAPFAIAITIFCLGFQGLVYSFYPYIIPGQLKIVDAAASSDSLRIILVGTIVVLPVLIGYTVFAYHVFRGKAGDLRYD